MPAPLRVLAVLGVAGGLLCSCGGVASNGVAKRKPAAILAAARTAADRASSVHVSGSIDSGHAKTTFDLDLVAGRGGAGQLSEGGIGFALVEIKGTAYVKGSPAFYARFAGPSAANLLEGRWLEASTTTTGFTGLATLTDQRRLVDAALGDVGTLTPDGTGALNGQKFVRLAGSGGEGTLEVASTGTPYPVQITDAGADGGTIAFDRWNAPVSLTAPSNPVSVATLRKDRKAGGG